MKKTCKLVYIVVCLLIMLLPFAGMIFWKTDDTTENKTLAEMPKLKTEGGINKEYLPQLGAYFEDHFAFRQYMIDADSNIQAGIFKTSNVDSVIVGTDGWLYYASTLDNYLSKNGLSSRGVFNAVHNMKLMQQYVEQQGAEFVLTIAPNKNSLYGENMPYYYQYNAGETENRLYVTEALEKQQVNYVDLYEAFESSSDILYLKRDSHWNNEGAVLAYHTIMDAFGLEHERYETVEAVRTKDYIGDLNSMLYPISSKPEWNITYQYEDRFSYIGSDNVEDSWLETENAEKEGSLLMFRDSFGNTLIPLMSNEFGRCYYSKAVPYNIDRYMNEYQPEKVVVEKVERNIEEFASMPAVFQGPVVDGANPDDFADVAEEGEAAAGEVTVGTVDETVNENSEIAVKVADANISFFAISGTVDDELLERESLVYIKVQDGDKSSLYEAFTISDENGDGGYLLYLDRSKITADKLDITVYVVNENSIVPICSAEIDMKTVEE